MTSTTTRPRIRLAVALGFGAAIALTLGIYGRIHDPTGGSLVTLFFTRTITLKAWLAIRAAVPREDSVTSPN